MKRNFLMLFMLLIPMHAQAEKIDVQLPESEVFKAYDTCLIEQAKVWDKVLENYHFQETYWDRVQREASFYNGYRDVVIKEDVGSVQLGFGPENGKLGMRIIEENVISNQNPYKIIYLRDVYLPFFKFYTENISHEVLNHFGERDEHEVRVATRLRLFPSVTNAPALFINAQTGLPVLDREGNALQLDSVKFVACLKREVTKGALDYAITGMNHLNRERADYIKRMAKESRDIGIVFRGQGQGLPQTTAESRDR